jgi:hypothetical protein
MLVWFNMLDLFNMLNKYYKFLKIILIKKITTSNYNYIKTFLHMFNDFIKISSNKIRLNYI